MTQDEKDKKINEIIDELALFNERLKKGDKYTVLAKSKDNDYKHLDVVVENMWHREAEELTEHIQVWVDHKNSEYIKHDSRRKKELIDELIELR